MNDKTESGTVYPTDCPTWLVKDGEGDTTPDPDATPAGGDVEPDGDRVITMDSLVDEMATRLQARMAPGDAATNLPVRAGGGGQIGPDGVAVSQAMYQRPPAGASVHDAGPPSGYTSRSFGRAAVPGSVFDRISPQEAANVMDWFRAFFQQDNAAKRKYLDQCVEGFRGFSVRSIAAAYSGTRAAPQQVSQDNLGGLAVPPQFLNEVIVELPRFTPFADSSLIRLIPMVTDQIDWPRVTKKPDQPTVTGEAVTYSETNIELGIVQLVARKLGVIIPMTEEMLAGETIGMIALIAELVAEAAADKRNALVTNGTGAGEPEGIRQNGDIATSAWDATDDRTKADSLIKCFHAISSSYRGNAMWGIHDSRIELIRKLKDTQGRYLWTDGFAETPGLILGRPVFENPDIPTNLGGGSDESEILFGDYRRGYALGQRASMEVQTDSSGDDWKKDVVNTKWRERYDGKVSDFRAFVRMTGVK